MRQDAGNPQFTFDHKAPRNVGNLELLPLSATYHLLLTTCCLLLTTYTYYLLLTTYIYFMLTRERIAGKMLFSRTSLSSKNLVTT